ncbi:MAG: CoA ester lyase [Acidimicrobiales bacterium]|jgi:citrate lyase subunit beta/citryl-CoA lyase|nr:CoA ester lyase [Actinomycetes bacterium]MDP6288069.1 CoA ester lyase [Acidimicrobiales bacterium]HCW01445.1 CoA ester lyase [Acidimicrobiaceae bacterium]MCP4852064.1 CoA ester lyase [Actinomycetes bacterium]MDP6909998.1 CoA ester lyase [Acidimicrobiales bacterium]|tara:strand:- start:1373 stop:2233 length:861 start_codon:yes stop_codon:yes gene_type:complete
MAPGSGSSTQLVLRSLLFAPGNRAEVLTKLPRSAPSGAVIDLEDAVPSDRKAEARAIAHQVAPQLVAEVRLFVRINAADTGHFAVDVSDGLPVGLTGVVVPKIESVAAVDAVAAALDAAGHPDLPIVAGLETVAGVVDARTVTTHPRVQWCYFGAEDYIADLGGVRTPGNHEVAVARAQIAQAAHLGGIQAIDMVVTDFGDEDRFRREAIESRSLGFSGKLCIHPSQVPIATEAFRPSADELAWATEIAEAYDAALAAGDASIAVNGKMVDEPVARRARALLAAAD